MVLPHHGCTIFVGSERLFGASPKEREAVIITE